MRSTVLILSVGCMSLAAVAQVPPDYTGPAVPVTTTTTTTTTTYTGAAAVDAQIEAVRRNYEEVRARAQAELNAQRAAQAAAEAKAKAQKAAAEAKRAAEKKAQQLKKEAEQRALAAKKEAQKKLEDAEKARQQARNEKYEDELRELELAKKRLELRSQTSSVKAQEALDEAKGRAADKIIEKVYLTDPKPQQAAEPVKTEEKTKKFWPW